MSEPRPYSSEWLESLRQPLAPVARAEIIGLDNVLEHVDALLWNLAHGEECGRGLLLAGDPGTGKTMVARYLATELTQAGGGRFYLVPADELSPERVRGMIKELDANPEHSVVYLDEVDEILRGPDDHNPPSSEARAITLALQGALDGAGVSSRRTVFVASTNLSHYRIGAALSRAGRFGAPLAFKNPDQGALKALYHLYFKDIPLAAGIDLAAVARISAGMTGADVREVARFVRARTARAGRSEIGYDDIFAALSARSVKWADDEAKPATNRTRFHEAAHALTGVALLGPDAVLGILFYASDHAAVSMRQPEEARTEIRALREIATLFAGRLAEEMRFGDADFGAGEDMKNADRLFSGLVSNGRYPRFSRIGRADHDEISQTPGAEKTALSEIRAELYAWAELAARRCLEANWGTLGELAALLEGRQAFDGEELRAFLFDSGRFVAPDLPELPDCFEPRLYRAGAESEI